MTDISPDEKATSAVACLKAAVAYCQSLGITVARVMTDNGACYRAKTFAAACKALNLKHIRTGPYTPQTNGKAERFIQTALCEWACARASLIVTSPPTHRHGGRCRQSPGLPTPPGAAGWTSATAPTIWPMGARLPCAGGYAITGAQAV